MNFLQATQNRVVSARNNEGGFTLAELLVSFSLIAILIVIALNGVGTLNTQILFPSLQHANNQDLQPAQVAAGSLDKKIEAFMRDNPDTPPTKALMTSKGYVNDVPTNVVWAFHTYGGPASPQRCVIAYITDDASGGYTDSNPAAFDSLYQVRSIGRNCQKQVSGSSTPVPNWDSQ